MMSFVGAIAVADVVRTTLGPKGMDKILMSQSGAVTVTNDGATILKSIVLENPAAKILVDISKVQDDEAGDGTTSVCVLAGELLREAEKLINRNIHPQTIIEGWRQAMKVALEALEAHSTTREDEEAWRIDLLDIAKTTLSSKVVSHIKDQFANLAVDAVMRLGGSTELERIQMIKKQGGTMVDSYLEEGFLLEKTIGVGQPKHVKNAKILVANTSMDSDKIKIYGARSRVSDPSAIAAIENAEREKMKKKVMKIIDHKCNVFINRQLIYNYPEQIFADNGVMAIEHADFDGIERLSLVLDGDIASTFDDPAKTKLGTCEEINEIMIGEDRLIKFSGCGGGNACTIVLRGATDQLLEEAERSLHDALCVVSQAVSTRKIVLGGGCSEMIMANAVDKLARTTGGKRSMAIESFANALRVIPTAIAENAGLDSNDLISDLRAAHSENQVNSGIDIDNGAIGDMMECGIKESFKVKKQIAISAEEAAEMILRVDMQFKVAPRREEGQG